MTHVKICYGKDRKYNLGGGESFNSLQDLIEYYKQNPMVETGGTVVHLRTPFNATRINASTIDSRVRLLSKENSANGGKSGFFEEFEYLQQQELKHSFYSRKEGQRQENRVKNRYKNILPFDYTRVKLKNHETEYINANYIKVDDEDLKFSSKHYIATQGPLNCTVNDFWWMIWQEKSRVIVMKTREVERGKTKCLHYWPTEEEKEKVYGKIKVCRLNKRSSVEFILREFVIQLLDDNSKEIGEERKIYQYHFNA